MRCFFNFSTPKRPLRQGNTAPSGAAKDMFSAVLRAELSEDVFTWLAEKEIKELELLRGQSSTWFYLEVRVDLRLLSQLAHPPTHPRTSVDI